ncbi:RluA family pseudouridine synthase [Acinetobacter sp. NIPH 2377]|jgi:tRNA pseudouridine32 synthase/23S rRNA pseudouridine746 synthase|uniref:RluA family pseudouridine synthase n=1 Tax=Acinetobacter terrestris TaxID=2529843 RepID=UPI00148FE99B|nr:RluA family pseudouridine synthase [Acinetobacter terrestris]NNH35179.1 RluA family pseudouridine synthase [Acinetobacter terrestris]
MTSTEFIPPMIDGVSASKVFLPKMKPAPATVYQYLCQQFGHIESAEWQQRFNDGLIYDALGRILNLNSEYIENSHVFYYRFLAHEIQVPFEHEILFENEHLLVIDKPHFLTISPTGQYVQETLLVRLKKQSGNEFLTPIHRLDRETAGVVLFSKQPSTRAIYQEMFAQRQVNKTYHAIAPFHADLTFPCHTRYRMEKGEPFYTMQVVEGQINSQTEIDLIEHDAIWGKYQLKPITGKQHQLRVHLNSLGIAIKNDPFYPVVQHKREDDFSAPLQLLAKHIRFNDPITFQDMQFSSNFELTL